MNRIIQKIHTETYWKTTIWGHKKESAGNIFEAVLK